MDSELIGTLAPDPALKGLTRFLEPEGRCRFLRELGAVLPVGEAARLTVIKQRTGQRAVVRVETLPPAAPRCWYAKFLRADRPRLREGLQRIASEAGGLGIHVPAPAAWLPRFRALVLEGADGTPVLSQRDARSFTEQVGIFQRIGARLARLHQGLSLPEKEANREVEIGRVRGVRDALGRHRPELIELFDEKLETWSARGLAGLAFHDPSLSGTGAAALARAPSASLHGDFHPGQILVIAARADSHPAISILDWDEACAGEAERDVGNFVAHLLLEALRQKLSASRAEILGRAFRLGYEVISPLSSARLDWYLRGSLLRLGALHADPSFGSDPPNQPGLAKELLADDAG